MGELQHEAFQFTFNGFLKVAFQGSRVTSDAGLILVRELDERLGLETLIAEHLSDCRQGLNRQFSLADLLRQSVYSRLAGYEEQTKAGRTAREAHVTDGRGEGHSLCRGRTSPVQRADRQCLHASPRHRITSGLNRPTTDWASAVSQESSPQPTAALPPRVFDCLETCPPFGFRRPTSTLTTSRHQTPSRTACGERRPVRVGGDRGLLLPQGLGVHGSGSSPKRLAVEYLTAISARTTGATARSMNARL